MTELNRRALYNALMRACFKAESLDRKCAAIGVTDTGLGQAAREFRWAAEQVEAQKGKRQ